MYRSPVRHLFCGRGGPCRRSSRGTSQPLGEKIHIFNEFELVSMQNLVLWLIFAQFVAQNCRHNGKSVSKTGHGESTF